MLRPALIALLALLAVPAGAAAHAECSPGWDCPFSAVDRFGGAAPTKVHDPAGLAVAPDGRIAVADAGAQRTLVLAPDGTLVRVIEAREEELMVSAVAFDRHGRLYTAGPGHIRRYGTDYAEQADITAGLLRGDGASGTQHYGAVRSIAVDGNDRLFALVDEVVAVYAPGGTLERELTRRPGGGDFSLDGTLAAEGDGRVLVGDVAGGRIQELRPDGSLVQTITDLPEGASLHEMALAPDGSLHVPGLHEIRVYDRSGAPVGGTPHELQWGQGAIAVTAAGYLLAEADRLSRVAPDGTALPPFGADPGMGLDAPRSVDVAADGRFVVADARDHRVMAFGPDGGPERVLAERPGDEPLSVALLPGGEVLAAWDSGRVERRTADGRLLAEWDVPGTPLLTGASAAADGTVWLRDRSALLHYTHDGALLGRIEAGLASTFAAGNGLDVGPDGNLYAAEPYAVAKLAPDGRVLARLATPLVEGVEVLPDGNLAVAAQNEVRLLSADGRLLYSWGDHGTPAGRMHLPFDVAVDGGGRPHVVDRRGHAVFRFTFQQRLGDSPAPVPGPGIVLLDRAATLRPDRTGAVRVRLACGLQAPCAGELRLRRRGSRRARILARRTFRIAAGQTARLRVQLRRGARRGLRRRGRLPARLHVVPAGGAPVRRAVVLARRVR